MLVMANVDVPLLVNVTTLATLVVPTGWLPKSKLVLDRLRAGPEGVPVPIKLITCGLPPALSVMMIAPARVPMALGAKLTLIVQLAPFGTLPPQLSVRVKSPLGSILVMVSAALPVLVSVTGSGMLVVPTVWLPVNERLRGTSVTTGAAPVPVRVIVRGLPLPLSVIMIAPVLVPRAVGLKVTLMVQPPPEATLLPQVFV